jgi:hypothetical protein
VMCKSTFWREGYDQINDGTHACVGASGRQPGSNAREGRSLDFDQRSRACVSRKLELDTKSEEDNRGERSD